MYGFLGYDLMVQTFSRFGYRDFHALYPTGELIAAWAIVRETGDPVSMPKSKPPFAEKIIAAVASTLPSPTFLPAT
jgi:hypothetical protein